MARVPVVPPPFAISGQNASNPGADRYIRTPMSNDVTAQPAATGTVIPDAPTADGLLRSLPVGVPRRLRKILCLDDFEIVGRGYLPRPIFGFVAGAVETNASL